tara:strand:+ start:15418 stop:15819 length:402 start_codon:yes stop_codon:yes gene_type:complete
VQGPKFVDKRDELPVLIDGCDYAVIGWGEQITDAGEIRIVAIYSQSLILQTEVSKSMDFIQGHNGSASPSDFEAAMTAANETFDKLTSEFVGPGMPVFRLDWEGFEDESGREDGSETDGSNEGSSDSRSEEPF